MNFTFGLVGFIVQVILAASCIIESRSAGGDIEDWVPRGEINKGCTVFWYTPPHMLDSTNYTAAYFNHP